MQHIYFFKVLQVSLIMGNETEKRLAIARGISSQLEGIARGVYLGGSMGYGQNYSVTQDSDIDMVVISDLNKIGRLSITDYFDGQTDSKVIDLFRKRGVNFFWVTKDVDGVQVNTFIYETVAYRDFCLLRGGVTGYIHARPSGLQTSYDFEGKAVTFERDVMPFSDGWLYKRKSIVDGNFVLVPPVSDFIVGFSVLQEQHKFITGMEENVWKAIVRRLVKEHGPDVDLSRFNVLNSYYAYNARPEKIPPGFEERITERTLEEVGKIRARSSVARGRKRVNGRFIREY